MATSVGCQLAFMLVSSWTLNANLLALVLNSVYNSLDQIQSAMGLALAISPRTVLGLLGASLAFNAAVRCTLLLVMYCVLLRGMGYQQRNVPLLVERYLFRGAYLEGGRLAHQR